MWWRRCCVAGPRPRLCVALTSEDVNAAASVEALTDLYEVRIDLIGPGWRAVAAALNKPWVATNRRKEEGGAWQGSEEERLSELLTALDLGASIVDIELAAPGFAEVVRAVRGRARCLVSSHNFELTPPLAALKATVEKMRAAGADICKVVTAARSFGDNAVMLSLVRAFPGVDIVAFAMGEKGIVSRVLSPLAGAHFTFASAATGAESAPGQVTAAEMRALYGALGHE